MKLAFLYNHDALHQVRHTAPVAAALAEMVDVAVTVLCSSEAQEAQARVLIGGAGTSVQFVRLGPGAVAGFLEAMLRRVSPFRRLAVLYHNRDLLAGFDAIVVPETTTLMLRDRLGVRHPKLVWIPHGAGDRSVGYRQVAKGFDLVLVAGPKIRERMIAAGAVTPQTCRITGYPKFDTVNPAEATAPLFDNGRPTVLYNPHFDPRLSSWYAMGEAVLDWFAGQSCFNLIFAPHVMLFQRRLHASVEHRTLRWRHNLPERYRQPRPGLLIDTGSVRSTDMTYTRSADIYIGDASSQIYEWIARPRPAIFLNPGQLEWRDDPNFAHWRLGEVVEDIVGLEAVLNRALARPHAFSQVQRSAFEYTFSVNQTPSSRRAAEAIAELMAPSADPESRT